MNVKLALEIISNVNDKCDPSNDMIGKIFRCKMILEDLLSKKEALSLDAGEVSEYKDLLLTLEKADKAVNSLPDAEGAFYDAMIAIRKCQLSECDAQLECDDVFKALYDARISGEAKFLSSAD